MNFENKLEEKCIYYAKLRGFITYKMNSYGYNFYPDRLFMKDGKVYLVEFKSPTGRLSEGQKEQFKILENKGFKVYIHNDLEMFKELIDNHNKMFYHIKIEEELPS